MPELKIGTGAEAYFDELEYNFGEVGPDDVIHYQFPYKKHEDTIKYIEKGCGCTSAYWSPEGRSVSGELKISATRPPGGYGDGETSVEKYVFVWLNDGNDRFIADHRKQKLQNPHAQWIKLTLKGKVVI